MMFSRCRIIIRIFRNNLGRRLMCPISSSNTSQAISFCSPLCGSSIALDLAGVHLHAALKVPIHLKRIFFRRNKMEMMRILFSKQMQSWTSRTNWMKSNQIQDRLYFLMQIPGLSKGILKWKLQVTTASFAVNHTIKMDSKHILAKTSSLNLVTSRLNSKLFNHPNSKITIKLRRPL